MSDSNESRKEYVKRIESEGYKVVYPKNHELQIDIDSEEQYKRFCHSMDVVDRNEVLGQMVGSITEKPSSSGLPKRHITISLVMNVTELERIAWQGALCSDPVRELLSLQRYYLRDEHPTLFKEKVK